MFSTSPSTRTLAARRFVPGFHHRRRPEMAETAHRDQQQQADHHHQADRHRAGIEPDPGAPLLTHFLNIGFDSGFNSAALKWKRIYGAASAAPLGHRVHHEGEHEQHQRRQEENAVMSPTELRLRHFHRDIGRQRAQAFEDVEIDHRTVTGRHQHDHGLADGAPSRSSPRRRCPGSRSAAHARDRLPGGCTKRQRAWVRCLGTLKTASSAIE